MSAETVAPHELHVEPGVGLPTARERLLGVRQRILAWPLSPEAWLLAGGSALALIGVLMAAISWPSIVADEFGSIVEGSAAWSAVGMSVAAIGGLMCVASAAAYGVLLGQEHAARGADRD